MQNVTMRIDGNKLVIEVDLTKEIASSSFLSRFPVVLAGAELHTLAPQRSADPASVAWMRFVIRTTPPDSQR
jgi:hypothetical protein